MQDTRDIVFFDQRGAGLSTPSLSCGEFDFMYQLMKYDSEDDASVPLGECRCSIGGGSAGGAEQGGVGESGRGQACGRTCVDGRLATEAFGGGSQDSASPAAA